MYIIYNVYYIYYVILYTYMYCILYNTFLKKQKMSKCS